MLAKAVAKESGARMLEIKGSEVYDMYVGEGEKNVKVRLSFVSMLIDRQSFHLPANSVPAWCFWTRWIRFLALAMLQSDMFLTEKSSISSWLNGMG